eukprot:gene27946-31019_t
MTSEATPQAIEDFETIEAAVMDTERGRWFLSEFARRHRQADTLAIVDKLDRIERTINRQRRVPDIDRIRLDLADMAEAITRTKQEIFQMKVESEEGGRFAEASNELDAIVSQTEQATETILQNAEKAQELAWTLRENNVAAELCDNLESYVTEIYTGCSFQDLTGQRTRKVVTVLRYLESRINSMTGIWGLDESSADEDAPVEAAPQETPGLEALEQALTSAPVAPSFSNPFETRPDGHLLNGPQLDGRGINQSDVDDLMDFSGSADDFVAVHASDTGQEQIRQQATADAAAEPQPAQPASATPPAKAAHAPEPELARETEIAPALVVVPISDPIGELSNEDKLIAQSAGEHVRIDVT